MRNKLKRIKMMRMLKKQPKRTRLPRPPKPTLRFNPTAWAKLLYLRDLGDTEIGGFGIAATDDLLYVEGIELVRQTCDLASVAFDDASVAEFFDRHCDAGRRPEQVGRIWIHSHPGTCPNPSGIDEATFARVFGRSNWAVMFILARGGATYARLQFHVGPGGSLLLPVEVDCRRPFSASDHAAWHAEYLANVQANEFLPLMIDDDELLPPAGGRRSLRDSRIDHNLWDDEWASLCLMEQGRRAFDEPD